MYQNESNTNETQAERNSALTDLEAQDEIVGGGALLNVAGNNTSEGVTVRGTGTPTGTVTFIVDGV